MNSGVYQIMNKQNYRMYIGSTVDFSERWRVHKDFLKKGKHGNIHLQNAWNKYGEDSFEFSVVEYVDGGKDAWVAREQYYTDLWNPEYAIQKECVISNLGCKFSNETKLKMMGNKNSLGCKRSDETKLKMSESMKGRRHSEETKRKISLALKDQMISEETKLRRKEYWENKRRQEW